MTHNFKNKNRDLFRWAKRKAVGYEELGEAGYMLLAERLRNDQEKNVVRSVIEKQLKISLNMPLLYLRHFQVFFFFV